MATGDLDQPERKSFPLPTAGRFHKLQKHHFQPNYSPPRAELRRKLPRGARNSRQGLEDKNLHRSRQRKTQIPAAGRVGKLQGITLCLLVGQDSVWPRHLPPLQLRGAHLAGLGQGQGGHLGLGAGRGAAGHTGQVLQGQRDTQPMSA